MKRFVSFLAVLGLIISLNGVAHATDFNRVGRVDVIEALSIIENFFLDFGTVSANNGFITLDPILGTITVDANGISVPGGTVAAGDYTVSGEDGNLVQIVVSADGMPPGLALSNFVTNPANLSNVALSGGSVNFTIGADLTVSGGVTTGDDQALNFTIAVTYN